MTTRTIERTELLDADGNVLHVVKYGPDRNQFWLGRTVEGKEVVTLLGTTEIRPLPQYEQDAVDLAALLALTAIEWAALSDQERTDKLARYKELVP